MLIDNTLGQYEAVIKADHRQRLCYIQ